MPRTTNRGSRVNMRRATTVGLSSFATLTPDHRTHGHAVTATGRISPTVLRAYRDAH